MRIFNQKEKILKLISLLFVLIYFVYATPFLKQIFSNTPYISKTFFETDGLREPLIRTITLVLIQTVFITAFSFVISLFLFNIKLNSIYGKILSLLLVPVVLGNVSVAFIYKLCLIESTTPFASTTNKLGTLSIIQIWQYGSLFIYLFWLNQNTIKKNLLDYTSTIKLTKYEMVRDVILPKQKNLISLVLIVCFLFCLYEDAKIQFIFRASRGTNTELVNQWMNRIYRSDSLINPEYAFSNIATSTIVVVLSAFVVIAILLFIKHYLLQSLLKTRKPLASFINVIKLNGKFTTVILAFLILLPFLSVFNMQLSAFRFDLLKLGKPLLLTLFASALATLIAISTAIISRLAWQKTLATFSKNSMIYILSVFSLILLPPIVLLVLSYKWMHIVGYNSPDSIYIAWFVGHLLLTFPILTGFSVTTHFKVNNTSIAYIDAHKLGLREKVRSLFWGAFKADYLLALLFAFSIIWNEGTINNILSDYIPSFVTEINKTITGKSADYSNGVNYLFVSILLAFASIAIWNIKIVKYFKKLENN
jgi:hypothetical protein